jgi:SOS-response transcriptional repressor LexA
MTAAQLSRLELGTRNLDLEDWVKILGVLGEKPGDWLDNSGAADPQLKPILDLFAPLNDIERHRMLELVRSIVGFADERTRSARVIAPPVDVVTFPQSSTTIDKSDPDVDYITTHATGSIRITLNDRDELQEAIAAASQGALAPRKVGRSDQPLPLIATVAASPDGTHSFRRTSETRDVNTYHIKHGVKYLMKVEGDSMADMFIKTGDLLYIRPTVEPRDGKVITCLVRRNGTEDFFVKVYHRDDDGTIRLSSENKAAAYPDIVIPTDQAKAFEYLGEVFGRYGDF